MPILRWRLNGGEVANPGEGEVQGARDRRGGEGHHIKFGADGLESLLRRNTEAVLLIHDQQAESAEGDVL